METKIFIKDFREIPDHRDFVLNLTDRIMGKFRNYQNMEASVIVGIKAQGQESHKHLFECEVLIHDPDMHRVVVAKGQNKDFQQAVRSSLRIAEKILRRNLGKRLTLRRHILGNHSIAV
jgi:ribosome-associated translation inhibitor RaiA